MRYGSMSIVISLILMAVVDALMVIFIKEWTPAMICSIVVIDLAFVLNMFSFCLNYDHRDGYVFQASASTFTSLCIVIEILITIVACIIKADDIIYILIEVLVLIVFILLFIANTFVNRKTIATVDSYDDNLAKAKAIVATLKNAMNSASDSATKKKVEYAYDKARSISGFDREGLEQIDAQLQSKADSILSAVKAGDGSVDALCNEFCSLADERAAKAAELKIH